MVTKTETLKIAAEERVLSGSRNSKRMRKEGSIPAVIYGSTIEPKSLKINRHDLEMLVEHHKGENIICNLVLPDETIDNVLIKNLQRDAISDHALHADFLKINMDRKLRIMVSIHLIGEPIGVTQNGGILEHQIRTVEVECLPSDIIKEFSVDISSLDVDDRIFARDLNVGSGLTVLTPGDTVVASVHMPKAEDESKSSADGAEGAEAAKGAEKAVAADSSGGEGKGQEKGKG